MRDGTTSEDRATQLLICEPLSFAIVFSSLWAGWQLGVNVYTEHMSWDENVQSTTIRVPLKNNRFSRPKSRFLHFLWKVPKKGNIEFKLN